MSIQIIPIFPSLILASEVENFKGIQKELINWIKKYQKVQDNFQVSGRNAWQSPIDFYKKEKSFFKYKNLIEGSILNMMVSITDSKCKISNMWINVNGPGAHNISHTHPTSDLSGVFWISIPKNSGVLRFESSNHFSEYKIIKNCKSNIKDSLNYDSDFWICPSEGKMVIFPSSLRHLVETNESTEHRISIAFNIDILN